jgi:hypothetical protein
MRVSYWTRDSETGESGMGRGGNDCTFACLRFMHDLQGGRMPAIVRFHEIGGPENLKLEE